MKNKITELTPEQSAQMKGFAEQWIKIGLSSVEASVWDSVRDSVEASVWTSVQDSVWAGVGDSVDDEPIAVQD